MILIFDLQFHFDIILTEDGYFLNWEDWTACSASCMAGTQSRERVYLPPLNGGAEVEGETVEEQACDAGPCPGKL